MQGGDHSTVPDHLLFGSKGPTDKKAAQTGGFSITQEDTDQRFAHCNPNR